MAMTSGQQAVGTTPVRIFDAGSDVSKIVVRNTGSTDVFLGGAGVTTANGCVLPAGAVLTLEIAQDHADDLYAVATVAGTAHWLAW